MNGMDIIKTLREDVEIPDMVQKKADAAFASIYRDAENRKKGRAAAETKEERKRTLHRHTGKKIWIAIAAALLAIGTISAAADYIKRSKSLTEGMGVTDEQQVQMEEEHLSELVNQSCTFKGITVTALQSITDNYYTHIAFQVEGYKTEPGVQPDFGTVAVTIDGNDGWSGEAADEYFNFSGGFYNGLVPGEDGRIVNADGSPVQTDTQGNIIENYVMEDGSMEYQITLSNTHKKGFFINKPIHVELRDLGTVSRASYETVVDGIWTFDWTLSGSPQMRECEMNVPLGDSGATVIRAEISPISLGVEYEFPRQEVTETIWNQDGQEEEAVFDKEPPRLMGVRMKDGTMYPYIYLGPGSSGYMGESVSRYRTVFAIDRILDVNQVQGLLFAKENADGTGGVEDMYYIAPVG